MTLFIVFAINTALVFLTIIIHYEVLFQLSKRLPQIKRIAPSYKVLICVFTIFLAHVVEIWLFGLGYYFSAQLEGVGNLFGKTATHGIVLDYVYLSFVTYTTVGYGDMYAISSLERIVSVIIMLGGVAFFSFIMGNFVEIIQS